MNKRRYPCTHELACHALYFVFVLGWTQQQAGLVIGIHPGTVNHIIHRRRFRRAYPVPPPGF